MNELITLTGYEATWWIIVNIILLVVCVVFIGAAIATCIDESDWEFFGFALLVSTLLVFFTTLICAFVYSGIRDHERTDQQVAWLASEGYTNIEIDDGDFTAADPDGKFTQGSFLPAEGKNEYWVVTRDD